VAAEKTLAKNHHNLFEKSIRFEGGTLMQKGIAIVPLVMLTALTTPATARNSGAEKNDERPASSSCHSYVQNPDGSWIPVPCQEIGPATQSQHKSPAKSEGDANR